MFILCDAAPRTCCFVAMRGRGGQSARGSVPPALVRCAPQHLQCTPTALRTAPLRERHVTRVVTLRERHVNPVVTRTMCQQLAQLSELRLRCQLAAGRPGFASRYLLSASISAGGQASTDFLSAMCNSLSAVIIDTLLTATLLCTAACPS
eukprot:TRINITY_DN19102_c0_g1_i1.p1 TRINITY_DN19102_c0_g1~~TRINITY_DN19102_c0_g1_i1.p1  ORF type:complete len:150 (-),score=21.67 TRINITY_DN19102_c0_g1_i1:59-508(-)